VASRRRGKCQVGRGGRLGIDVIRQWAKLASAAAFALLAVGCAANADQAANAGPAAIVPSASPIKSSIPDSSLASALKAQYPVNAYMPTGQQQAELTVVTGDLVSECMRGLGFDYAALRQSPSQYYKQVAEVAAATNSRVWGISDLQVAERIGYNLPDLNTESRTPAKPLSPREQLDLTGSVRTSNGTLETPSASSNIPTGGCETEANAELASYNLGQSESYESLPTDISLQSFHAAVASAQVKQAFGQWSACMRTHGYHYADPFAAAASFDTATTTSYRQIQVAVTDIGCSRLANVQGVGFAVESAYQRQMIQRYAAQLSQLKKQLQAQTNTLAKLVRQYGAEGDS
jgi:hypothetical protein